MQQEQRKLQTNHMTVSHCLVQVPGSKQSHDDVHYHIAFIQYNTTSFNIGLKGKILKEKNCTRGCVAEMEIPRHIVKI